MIEKKEGIGPSFDMDDLLAKSEKFLASKEAEDLLKNAMRAAEQVSARIALEGTIDVATLHTRMSI